VEGSARPPQAITTASRSTRSKKVQCDNNNIELGVAAARMDYELADVKSSAPHHALHFTTKPTPTSSQHYDEPRHTTNSTTVFYESNATTNNSEVTKVLEDVTCPRGGRTFASQSLTHAEICKRFHPLTSATPSLFSYHERAHSSIRVFRRSGHSGVPKPIRSGSYGSPVDVPQS
jgi:hypothetical protein